MTTQNTQQQSRQQDRNPPTHVVKVRTDQGRTASYERIGVAWFDAEKGSTYVRLYGTQIMDSGFTLYPIEK